MGRANVVVFNNFQQYYSYIMAVDFIGEGPRTTRQYYSYILLVGFIGEGPRTTRQYYSYILLVGFIGEGSRTSRRKSLTNIKREGEVNKVVLTLETTKLFINRYIM